MRLRMAVDVQGATREGREREFHFKVGSTTREREKGANRSYRMETSVEIEEYSASERPVAAEATPVTSDVPVRWVVHDGRAFRDASSGGGVGTTPDLKGFRGSVFDLRRLVEAAEEGRVGRLLARRRYWPWDAPERVDVRDVPSPEEAGVVAFRNPSLQREAELDVQGLADDLVLVDGRPHVACRPPSWVVKRSYNVSDPPEPTMGDGYPSTLEALYHPADVPDGPRRGDLVVHDPSIMSGWASRDGCLARTLAPLVKETWFMLGLDRDRAEERRLRLHDHFARLPDDWDSGTDPDRAAAEDLVGRIAADVREGDAAAVAPLVEETLEAHRAAADARAELERDGSSSRRALLDDLARADARVVARDMSAALDALVPSV